MLSSAADQFQITESAANRFYFNKPGQPYSSLSEACKGANDTATAKINILCKDAGGIPKGVSKRALEVSHDSLLSDYCGVKLEIDCEL